MQAKRTINIRDDTHMTSMKIVQFSRPPPPFSIYVQNSSTPLTLDVQFQTTTPSPPPLQMIPCMRTNEIKTKTKPSEVTFKLTTRSILLFISTNNTIKRWLHCLTSKGRFLVNNTNIWLSMMSNHGANPIFCNKKNKDWTSRTLANPRHPPTSDSISFLP